MKKYAIQVEDRRPAGGCWVVFVRRYGERAAEVGPSCIGVGASFHALQIAMASALHEVRYRRRAGQFRSEDRVER